MAQAAGGQGDLLLRDLAEGDLPILFAQQLDAEANQMAAFTAKDPSDRRAFDDHWARVLRDESVFVQVIVWNGALAGSVVKYVEGAGPEVSYWLGREFWGQGIATRALAQFLSIVRERPIYARAAADNLASRRVLEKCGFRLAGHDRGYAHARGQIIDEVLLRLDAGAAP